MTSTPIDLSIDRFTVEVAAAAAVAETALAPQQVMLDDLRVGCNYAVIW